MIWVKNKKIYHLNNSKKFFFSSQILLNQNQSKFLVKYSWYPNYQCCQNPVLVAKLATF